MILITNYYLVVIVIFFYQEIAKTTINKVENELKDNCIHFTLNNFYKKKMKKS